MNLIYRIVKNNKTEIHSIEEKKNETIQLCSYEKDKNGNYIFEEDVVRFVNEDGEHIGVVRFREGEFCVDGEGFYDYDGKTFFWKELEIIK